MKRLGILRHAKSDWDDMSLRDFDRGLNDRGRKGAALMGEHIREQGEKWEMILASPAARIRQTLAASGLEPPISFAEDAYLGDSQTLMGLLHDLPADPHAVLLAAHNPGVHELAIDLVDPDHRDELYAEVMLKFPTASFAILELDIENWEDCIRGCGKLVHFSRPRDLDPDLGPLTPG